MTFLSSSAEGLEIIEKMFYNNLSISSSEKENAMSTYEEYLQESCEVIR